MYYYGREKRDSPSYWWTMEKKRNKRSRFVRAAVNEPTKGKNIRNKEKKEGRRNLVALTGSCITSFLTLSLSTQHLGCNRRCLFPSTMSWRVMCVRSCIAAKKGGKIANKKDDPLHYTCGRKGGPVHSPQKTFFWLSIQFVVGGDSLLLCIYFHPINFRGVS